MRVSPPEPPSIACAEHLAALYRFVFLLTGGNGGRTDAVLEPLLERAAARFVQIRCSRQAASWLFAEARAQCRRQAGATKPSRRATTPSSVEEAPGEEPSVAPRQLAASFGALPEPERAALALFYLQVFSRQELFGVLGVRPEELGLLLLRARALLRTDPAVATLTVDAESPSLLAASR